MKTTATQKAIENKIGMTQDEAWVLGTKAQEDGNAALARVTQAIALGLSSLEDLERQAASALSSVERYVAKETETLELGYRMDATWLALNAKKYEEVVARHTQQTERVLEYAALRKVLLGETV